MRRPRLEILTASKLGDYFSCPETFFSEPPRTPTPGGRSPAEVGTALHSCIQAMVDAVERGQADPEAAGDARAVELDVVLEWRSMGRNQIVDLVDILTPHGPDEGVISRRTEITYGLRRDGEVQALGSPPLSLERLHADAGREFCFAGTADLVIRSERELHVLDFKTGAGYVGHPRHNWQIRSLLAMALGADPFVPGPRRLYGHVYYTQFGDLESQEYSAAEIRGLLPMLERLPIRSQSAFFPHSPRHAIAGDHCRYCGRRGDCGTFAASAALTRRWVTT